MIKNRFILGLLLGIVIMYVLHELKGRCLVGPTHKNIITILTRQAARWATAAKQDKNSMISVLHANYGAGYLWALKDIATAEQVKQATGIDLVQLEYEIVTTQDMATKRMARLCPKYAPEPSYLTKIAGEG